MDVSQKRNKYNDRCKWYKGDAVTRTSLVPDAVCQGIFYSRDKVSQTEEEIVEGNIKKRRFLLTIETPDFVSELTTDDYVLYTDDLLWRVQKITRDDANEAKEFSARPSVITILELWR